MSPVFFNWFIELARMGVRKSPGEVTCQHLGCSNGFNLITVLNGYGSTGDHL
jgi:hypothetical protein